MRDICNDICPLAAVVCTRISYDRLWLVLLRGQRHPLAFIFHESLLHEEHVR